MQRYPIQAHNVVVALSCVELDGEATGITGRVWELSTKSNGREANEDRSLGPRTLQEARLAAPGWSVQRHFLKGFGIGVRVTLDRSCP